MDTWAHDTVKWYWSADILFWQPSIDHNIDVQLVFYWAPKLARKCESKHWFPCGADGRSFVRCTVTWLPNFLGWVDLLTHGAPLARASHPRAPLFNLQSAAYSSLPQHGTFVYRGEVFNRDHFFLSVKNCGLLQFAFLFPQYVELFVCRFGHLGAYLFVYRCRYNAWK